MQLGPNNTTAIFHLPLDISMYIGQRKLVHVYTGGQILVSQAQEGHGFNIWKLL